MVLAPNFCKFGSSRISFFGDQHHTVNGKDKTNSTSD